MKKHFLFTCMAVIALLMGACNEEENLRVHDGNEVTFNVTIPELGTSTRAVGDGLTATTLYWGVYDHGGNLLPDISNQTGQAFTGSDKVRLTLAQDKSYSIIFWAANAGNSMCTVNWTDRKMTVTPTEANQEAYDAFCSYEVIENVSGYMKRDVKLYRPFAQLNIGTADYDKAAASGLTVENTQVEIAGLPTAYDFVTGMASGETTFTYAYPDPAVDVRYDIDGDGNKEIFPVEDDKYDYLSMNYLLVGRDPQNPKELVTVTFKYKDDDDQEHVRTYSSVPVQRNWRTNIYGNILTSEADFTVTIMPGFGDDNEQDVSNIVYASTAEEVLKALASDEKETVKIVMLNDITLPGGTSAYTTNAKEVIIESNQSASTRSESGQKFTLTFKDSYRTYFGLANKDAKVTFNNVNIYRETTGGTHWHDNNMKFTCNAEFKNVDFNKGICFDNAKTFVMNNCSINKGKVATYALFITAGCNVTIDGLSVTHSEGVAGRGIKIVDEDVAEKDALTTLSVSNAAFVTEEKAAILVGSQGGAKITLSNLDLTGVKADGFNAVWIDEDYKGISVEVEGGFCVTEGETQTEENNPFLVEGNTVEVAKGVYSALPKVANGVTINCEEGVVFEGQSSLDIQGSTINGGTFSNEAGNVVGGTINGTFKGCTFTGSNALRYCYAGETCVFEDCVFDGAVYGAHFDGGANNVTFRRCTFSGFNAFGAALTMVTFDGCTFKSNGRSGYNGANLWGNTTMIGTKFVFDGTVANEWIDCIGVDKTYTFTGCTINEGSLFNGDYFFSRNNGTKITVDGTVYTSTEGGYLYDENNGIAYVSNKDALSAALNAGKAKIVLAPGTYEGTYAMKDGVTIQSMDDNNMATVDCINLNGADNITLKNIQFDAAGAQLAYDGKGNKRFYGNIISGDASKKGEGSRGLVIDGCVFTGTFANGGTTIAFNDQGRGTGQSGNITIKNCTFETVGGYVDIYTYYSGFENLIIENNTFNSTVDDRPIYLGRYQSSTPVVVKGNAFKKVAKFADAAYIQAHSSAYTVSFDESGNTFAQ